MTGKTPALVRVVQRGNGKTPQAYLVLSRCVTPSSVSAADQPNHVQMASLSVSSKRRSALLHCYFVIQPQGVRHGREWLREGVWREQCRASGLYSSKEVMGWQFEPVFAGWKDWCRSGFDDDVISDADYLRVRCFPCW
jgi:hypothetical protein